MKRLLVGYPIFGAGIIATKFCEQSEESRPDVLLLIGLCTVGFWIIAAICVGQKSAGR